jgi:serine/threonine-protein kinase
MSEPLSAGVESGAIDRLMADVVAEITDRLHAGEPVDAAAYMKRHPELADRLRPMLAALDVLAQFSSSAGSERRSGRSVAGEQLGGTLGDFRILREVGRGGMGVVYEAEQISLQRRVALKILPFAATMDPRQLQRFHNEARAAACLDHPHIVKVHAVGCERGVHYFAMKFIEGQSLAVRRHATNRNRNYASIVARCCALSPYRPMGHRGRRGAGARAQPGHRSPRHQAGQSDD